MNTPEGWKLVPVEIAPEMRKAAADAWLDCGDRLLLNKAAAALRAGIAAAPTPPERPAAQGELTDRGPWKVTEVGNLQSDDFEHDVTLQISGDFEFEDQRLAYADGLCNLLNSSIAAHNTARKRPAAQCEGYLSGVNVEALLRACAELGLSAEHSLEALAVPDVLAEHINRVSRAVIATARKRPEAEVAEIMEAADRYVTAKLFRAGPVVPDARAEVERLVRGDKS